MPRTLMGGLILGQGAGEDDTIVVMVRPNLAAAKLYGARSWGGLHRLPLLALGERRGISRVKRRRHETEGGSLAAAAAAAALMTSCRSKLTKSIVLGPSLRGPRAHSSQPTNGGSRDSGVGPTHQSGIGIVVVVVVSARQPKKFPTQTLSSLVVRLVCRTPAEPATMASGSDAEQEQKRAAAAAYDYEGDARWADYWSNILVPPHLASRPDVIDHYKRKFYQRHIVSSADYQTAQP